jgi:hypothetical protein
MEGQLTNKQLAGGWTFEKLQAKTPEERFNVWVNARRLGTPEALELATFIEGCGLDYGPTGGISMSDPRVVEMDEIINSDAGRTACLKAVQNGEPALSGVERLIVAQMKDRYGAHSQMTVTAGSLVGMLMYSLGYEKGRSRSMPEGSVATQAATWIPKRS